jgi:hypothetical protein
MSSLDNLDSQCALVLQLSANWVAKLEALAGVSLRTAGKGANSEIARRHLQALIAKKGDSAFCTRCTSQSLSVFCNLMTLFENNLPKAFL